MNEPAPRVSHLTIATAFNHVALASFGGGLSAWSREIIVDRKKWLDDKEFLAALTMCRILPGANQVNIAVFVGTKLRGATGAVAAVLGLMCVPVALTLLAGWAFFKFKEVPGIHGTLHGASAAAVALTVAMVVKTGRECLTGLIPVALFATAFVLNGILRWPLLVTLAILIPLCLLWAWPRGSRTDAAQTAQ